MSTNPALWVGYPRSYTAGRARAVQFVTLHYTAGAEGPQTAEAGANYDKNRTDGTSCHAFADSAGPPIQEVPIGDRSHSALFHGNEIGVHVELCGTVQTRAQWLDPTSLATLQSAASFTAYVCDTLGLARRRLSVDETRAAYYAPAGQRPTGINDHYACTLAFPEDGGDHTDVGGEFPWDVFMGMLGSINPSPGPLPPWADDEEYEMKGAIVQTTKESANSQVRAWVDPILGPVYANMVGPEYVPVWVAQGFAVPASGGYFMVPRLADLGQDFYAAQAAYYKALAAGGGTSPTPGLPEHQHDLSPKTGGVSR